MRRLADAVLRPFVWAIGKLPPRARRWLSVACHAITVLVALWWAWWALWYGGTALWGVASFQWGLAAASALWCGTYTVLALLMAGMAADLDWWRR